jgi:polysaccharide biosynthesis transport protein
LSGEPLEVLKAKRNFARAQADRLKAEAIKISDTRSEIESIQTDLGDKRRERGKLDERLSLLNLDSNPTKSSAIGRVEIISEGEEATLYSDTRKKLGALGFLLGGSLPIFGVMLLGAMDRRFRYSEDAQAGAARVPLLGILPYLPDIANDPDQAGIAAHCVHQIRTLLQIGGVEHDRKVFAVTSATSGDGKTSLSLSLGLSFAASGSNTLLIDFDMIGGGLTANMGARSDVGLLAAIDDGQLEGHVRPTAFPRLSLIPAGRDDAQEVSRLSPKLVRRIIEAARKQYDVVVIDTGPILGSIEATLVCGIADGVVLALGRGQHKDMAARAVETLRSVGAHIMGVVFNRAQAGDFRRTVSQSVRSIPMHDSGSVPSLKALPALGPMARTVASHLRSDG